MADAINLGPFSNPNKPQGKKGAIISQDYSEDIIKLNRRIKILEEGLSNLRRKLLVNEQNDLNRHKKVMQGEKANIGEVNDIKKEVENIKITMKEFVGELRTSARKEEVRILKKYIDMWDPVSFVTFDHIDKVVDEKIEDYFKNKAVKKK